ncbi:MAG: branched-chain amino acid ABC transporter permease [Acetobacteraceae bacterium]|nr:branched-chain amino acid ABC transporter permease [Acetobacteraceae bacterium]
MENYIVAMLVFAAFYGMMALGLNLIWGMAGMINLGIVGFFGFGAYVSAMLTRRHFELPIPAGWVAATVLTALAGCLVALTVARLKGDYLAIVTLGFAEIVRLVGSNEIWLTGGTDGISGIPGPWRGSVPPQTFNLIYLGIAAVAVGLSFLVCQRIRFSPYGRVLRAIRDDEQVAAVAGKNVLAFKLQVFAVGAAIIGLAGALYGHYNAYIAPDGFVPLITIYVVLALTAGGTGSNTGALAGSLLVVFFMESMRFVVGGIGFLKPVQVAALREFLIGLSLIVVLRFAPQGLFPERLHVHKVPPA